MAVHNFETDGPREKILELWRQLPQGEKERLLIQLLLSTDVGRKLAAGGMPYIPHHMWERSPRER